MRKATSMFFSVLILLAVSGIAQAELRIGPIGPNTGFPRVIGDGTTRLKLCLPQSGAFCEPDPVIPGNLQSRATGFGGTASYYNVTAQEPATAIGKITVTFSVQATYGATRGAAPVPGPTIQRVVNSIVITLVGMPAPGVYTVDHPYGTNKVTVDADLKGKLTLSKTGFPATNFAAAATGPVGFFLKALKPPLDGIHIGGIANPQLVTGSPLRNNVVVTAPVGVVINSANNSNVVTIPRMTIEGMLF